MSSYEDNVEVSEDKEIQNMKHETVDTCSDLPYLKNINSKLTDHIPCFDIKSIPDNETGSLSADDVSNYDKDTIIDVENVNTLAYSENESLNVISEHTNDDKISLLQNTTSPCLKNEKLSFNWQLSTNNNILFANQNVMIPDFVSARNEFLKHLQECEGNTLPSTNTDTSNDDDVIFSDNSNSSMDSNLQRSIQNIINNLYKYDNLTENISGSNNNEISTLKLKNCESDEPLLSNNIIQYVSNNLKVSNSVKNLAENIICINEDQTSENKNVFADKNEVYHVFQLHNNEELYLGEINSGENNLTSLDDEKYNFNDSSDDSHRPCKRICLESLPKNNVSSFANAEVDHSVKNEIVSRDKNNPVSTLQICPEVKTSNKVLQPNLLAVDVSNEIASASNFSCVNFETDNSADRKLSIEKSLVEYFNFKAQNDISSNHPLDDSASGDDSSYFAFPTPTSPTIANYRDQVMTCSSLSTPDKNQNYFLLSDNMSTVGQCSANNLNLLEMTKNDNNENKSVFPGTLKLIPVNELNNCIPAVWNKDCDFDQVVIHEINLKSQKAIEIANLFGRSGKSYLKLKSIHRIENRYQWLNYQLKKIELTKLFGKCEEKILFHGTRVSSFNSICNTNFDWRYGGSHRGHKFGMGVSFSPIATYASHYTDQFDDGTTENKMILARVLVAKTIQGKPKMSVPPPGYDTTCNHEHKVYVKFDDFSYYPEYELCYTGKLFDYYAERMRLRELEKLASKLSSNERRMRPHVDINHPQQQFHRDDFYSSNDPQFMMPSVPGIVQIQNDLEIKVNVPPPLFAPPASHHYEQPPVFNSPAFFDNFPEVNVHQLQTNVPAPVSLWQPPPSPHEMYHQNQNRSYQLTCRKGQEINYQNIQNNMLPPTPYMRPAQNMNAQKRKRGGKKKRRSCGSKNSPHSLPTNSPRQNNFVQQVWQPWASNPLKNKSTSNKFKHAKSHY